MLVAAREIEIGAGALPVAPAEITGRILLMQSVVEAIAA